MARIGVFHQVIRDTRTTRSRPDRARSVWPVLGVLLAAAVAPAVCVLWFMNAAMRNERLAVRQRLLEAYRQKVETDQSEIGAFLEARLVSAPTAPVDTPSAQALFGRMALDGRADSFLVFDGAGAVMYPRPPADRAAAGPDTPAWREARQLEFVSAAPAQAADAYRRAAEEFAGAPGEVDFRAQAMLAEARCLARAGRRDRALKILLKDLSAEPALKAARDAFGRSVQLDAGLLALEILGPDDGRARSLAGELAEQVNRYDGGAVIPGSQRLLAMDVLEATGLIEAAFPTRGAEQLAQRVLARPVSASEPLIVAPAGEAGLWRMASADSRVVELFREERLLADLRRAAKLDEPTAGIITEVELPGRRRSGGEPFLTAPVSDHLPGWRLAVYLEDEPFAASAERAERAYLAAGVSAVAIIAALAVMMAAYLGRQIKLTRLKNDLIATASHELKTPLASIRVLIDTLRDGRCADDRQAGEYVELIAAESERLSRLIDNFLTFSRMERNKRAFTFSPTDVTAVVRAAAGAVGERFVAPGVRLDIHLPADLPAVRADADALTTVFVNLLDNAWKYTGETKHVAVRAFGDDGEVAVEVTDDGVGLSRRAMRRIFDKFYQVDRTLSRKAGGCGLGLSIVKFILDAHGGDIRVTSRPGRGSTFVVRLPAAGATGEQRER